VSHHVRFTKEAVRDLQNLYDWVQARAGPVVARNYVARLIEAAQKLSTFPHRGTVHEELGKGVRTIGFERRVSIVFVVQETEVDVLRLLYAGRRP
jgi:toxin ParE1/3/4